MTPLPYETTLKDVESRPDSTELRRAEFLRMIGPPHEFLAAFIMSIAWSSEQHEGRAADSIADYRATEYAIAHVVLDRRQRWHISSASDR